jgi:hypothetical protein
MWWTIFVLFVLLILVFVFHTEPPALTELKQRYWATLEVLRTSGDPMWAGVLRPAILTGMCDWTKCKGSYRFEREQGYEIYICLDDGGDVNSAMYVLIHELAHMSVPEYDHTDKFWKISRNLRNCASERVCTRHQGNVGTVGIPSGRLGESESSPSGLVALRMYKSCGLGTALVVLYEQEKAVATQLGRRTF